MKIVAVTFEEAQKHINALRCQNCILLSVKRSHKNTKCSTSRAGNGKSQNCV